MKLSVIKTILMSAGLMFVLGSVAQTSKRTSAYYEYKDWKESGDKTSESAKKSIVSAKKLIDEVYAYSSAKFVGSKDAKTLYYKGQIYTAFQYYVTDETMKEHNPAQTMAEGLVAYKAHVDLPNKKSKDNYSEDIKLQMAIMRDQIFSAGGEMFNKGLEADKAGDAEKSKKFFEQAMMSYVGAAELMKAAGQIDTVAYYNAGLSGTFAKKWDVAAKSLQICVDNGFGGAAVYSQLADAYYSQDKSEEGTAVLEAGRKKYPKDINLYTSEGNYWLGKKDSEKAAKAYEGAIFADPSNEAVYFSTGALYSEMQNFEKAETMFKKALEIKPDYSDAMYAIGALYFNQGQEIRKQIDEASGSKVDPALEEKKNNFYKQTIPYAKKVREMAPNDKQNLLLLYKTYEALKMKEESKEISDILFN